MCDIDHIHNSNYISFYFNQTDQPFRNLQVQDYSSLIIFNFEWEVSFTSIYDGKMQKFANMQSMQGIHNRGIHSCTLWIWSHHLNTYAKNTLPSEFNCQRINDVFISESACNILNFFRSTFLTLKKISIYPIRVETFSTGVVSTGRFCASTRIKRSFELQEINISTITNRKYDEVYCTILTSVRALK